MRHRDYRVLPLVSLLLASTTLCGCPAWAAPRQERLSAALTRHIAAIEAEGKIIPIRPVGERPPTIDGDLSDWGTLDPRAGCLVQGVDDAPGLGSAKGKDAAVFNLRYDDQALYVAVRVLDASLKTQDPYYLGDCVQLFLDVRPTTGTGPKLGDSAWSDGVYQLMIAAPSPDHPTVRWLPGAQKVAPLGPIEIATRALPDGYTMEMRLPFSSLKGMTPDRLKEPIGIDLYVDDIDVIGKTGSTTPRSEYALSGSDSSWQDASLLCLARVDAPTRYPAPFVRPLPGRYSEETGRRRIAAGLITTRDAAPEQCKVEIHYGRDGGGPEAVPPLESAEITDYPPLGIRISRRTLDLQSLALGRYTVSTHYPGLPDADSATAFETVTWRRRPALAQNESSQKRMALPDRLLENGRAMRLPNGWRVTPVGHALALPGDMPQRMLLSPDGRYLLVSTGGYHDHGIHVIDTAREKLVQSIDVGKTWTGMCLDARRNLLFLSGGGIAATSSAKGSAPVFARAVLCFDWQNGRLARRSALDLPAGKNPNGFVGGMAAGKDGSLYVVETQSDRVLRLDGSFQARAVAKVGYRPNAIAVSPSGQQIAVSDWGDRSVHLLEAKTLALQGRVAVGSHPVDLAFAPDGRLFVADAGSNSVSVIRNGKVVEMIKTSLDPKALVGSTPDALAFSPNGKRLYVANADNNNVAVIDTSHGTESRILGFIPTGWYPSALGVSRDGRKLFIGTGKGLTFHANGTGAYIGTLLQGHVCVVPAPEAGRLAAYTRQVVANTPLTSGGGKGQPDTLFASNLSHKIKHVLYIIRENRTYDQVFGDIAQGNGDPSLTLFGKDATPNAHALAKNYILLDNLYCNGEVSEDGHEWCNAAYATDFTERAWPNSYSDRGEPDADTRLTESPAGYLWDNCVRHGLSYYSYGEFVSFKASPKSPPVYTGNKSLGGHTSFAWTQFSYDRHDTEKTTIFLSDLHRAEKTGKWPRFMVMSLGEDHTQGSAPGKYTPLAHVAANDQALGEIVDAISHSRFWPETAIFVIEDDAQDGPDHVDAHRTVGLLISPYVRHGKVDSTFYTTASFVHTMELILGLPPMTQYDATATPLTAAFMPKPDLTPYRNLSPRVNLEARNGATGPGAVASAHLDFSHYDRVPPELLNRLLWDAMKPGIAYPAPVRSALVAFTVRKK